MHLQTRFDTLECMKPKNTGKPSSRWLLYLAPEATVQQAAAKLAVKKRTSQSMYILTGRENILRHIALQQAEGTATTQKHNVLPLLQQNQPASLAQVPLRKLNRWPSDLLHLPMNPCQRKQLKDKEKQDQRLRYVTEQRLRRRHGSKAQLLLTQLNHQAPSRRPCFMIRFDKNENEAAREDINM